MSSRFGTQFSMFFSGYPLTWADAGTFFELLYVTPDTIELNLRRA